MKTLALIVLALCSLTDPPTSPASELCYRKLAERMQYIQTLVDGGLITEEQAKPRRQQALKDYVTCIDSIPPTTPN